MREPLSALASRGCAAGSMGPEAHSVPRSRARVQAGLRDDNRSSPDYRTKFNALSALAAAGASGIPRAEFVQLLGSAKLLAELNQAGLINLPDRVSNVRFHSRGARWFAERALLPP